MTLGFDLSAMSAEIYDEAIVDVVGPDAILSKSISVKVNDIFSSTSFGLTRSIFFRTSC